VYISDHSRFPAVWPPGVCPRKKCSVIHTSDWRVTDRFANGHRIEATQTQCPLEEALRRVYRTEAHVSAYAVRDSTGVLLATQPRVAKAALPWLRAQGYDVVLTCFLADLDTPGHLAWTPETRATWVRRWAEAPALQTCGMYWSPKGVRLLQPLKHPLAVDLAEPLVRVWLGHLVREGLWPSVLEVKDWTRLMRAPHHQRPTGPVRSEGIDLSRMRVIDPSGWALPAPTARRSRPRAVPPATAAEPGYLPVEVPDDVPLPPEWERVAVAVGTAIRDTVRADWRSCVLALSGALIERGCPPPLLPAVIGHAHDQDPGWAQYRADRTGIARTTRAKAAQGLPVRGYGALRGSFPGVADALDGATISPAEARVRRQIALPAPVQVPLADALATIRAVIATAPPGVTLLAAPPGTGKTRAVVDLAGTRPPIEKRAAPGSRIGILAPTHKLALQIGGKLPRVLRLFSPPSYLDSTGAPVCVYVDSAKPLASGGQSVARELCEGRGRAPCDRAATCAARPGQEGDPKATLVTGVHGLVPQVREILGPSGLLVFDEPPDMIASERVTLDDLDTARRCLGAFVARYAQVMAVALAAFDAWVRALGMLDAPDLLLLPDVVRAGLRAVPPELLADAGLDPELPADDVPDAVLLAVAESIDPTARRASPPLRWSEVSQARGNPARAAEIGTASRVLNLLRRGLVARAPWAARLDERGGERAVTLVGPSEALLCALAHEGPVVILDADAALHAPAIARVLGYAPRLVEIAVADGAKIDRTVLVSAGATRSHWLPRGVPDWSAILPALRATIAWMRPYGTVGLIAPQILEVAIAHTLDPDAAVPRAQWKALRQSASALDRARAQLAPVLAGYDGTILTAHYGGLEGLDIMSRCDATVTVMDPRPNLGIERDKAAYLGLDPDGRLDALAAAELRQAHGRLRTIHRTRPGAQLHVGTVVPAGWAGLDVTVRSLPAGRPPTTASMTAEAFREARTRTGLGVRDLASALHVTHPTVLRYESGERAVPADVARAVRSLAETGTETPITEDSLQGFRYQSSPVTPAQGVSVPLDDCTPVTPAQGVSVPPLNGATPASGSYEQPEAPDGA
jgi:DNA-binding transcriptional regulator YiaG